MRITKTKEGTFIIEVADFHNLTDWEKRAMEGCCGSEYFYFTNIRSRHKISARLKSEVSFVDKLQPIENLNQLRGK